MTRAVFVFPQLPPRALRNAAAFPLLRPVRKQQTSRPRGVGASSVPRLSSRSSLFACVCDWGNSAAPFASLSLQVRVAIRRWILLSASRDTPTMVDDSFLVGSTIDPPRYRQPPLSALFALVVIRRSRSRCICFCFSHLSLTRT